MAEDVIVRDSQGKEVESELIPITDAFLSLRSFHVKAYPRKTATEALDYWLVFAAFVPALGFTTIFISSAKGTGLLIYLSIFKFLAGSTLSPSNLCPRH